MALFLEQLDPTTRSYMASEFAAEQASGAPFVPARLTRRGVDAWPLLMADAMADGDDETLRRALLALDLIVAEESYDRGGITRRRAVNRDQATRMLATSEFNTWYVRGLSARLLDEGVEFVEIYRAAEASWAPAGCAAHEGRVVSTQAIYDGHRGSYWPIPRAGVLSVPFQPGCHHSIRVPRP